jgi:protocatechuate 3,4-dioxygenase alpha subunit
MTAKPTPELKETPSQTAGPFVHIGMAPRTAGLEEVYPEEPGHAIAGPQAPGKRIRIEGRILDGDGAPVRDALIEVWQADHQGIYASPLDPRHAAVARDFAGWGRVCTDFRTGAFLFETVKPGAAPGPKGSTMAPHLALWIVARGINLGLSTRLYFPEDTDAHAADPVLARIENPARRATLVAEALEPEGEMAVYRFAIRLQGDGETVFFAT